MKDDVDVIIQAGGKGTRLRPYTEVIPKPMLPYNGKPIIAGLLDRVIEAEFKRCYISVGHLSYLIKMTLGDFYKGCELVFLDDDAPTGTIGAVRDVPARHVLSINGDLIVNTNLGSILGAHFRNRNDITVASRLHQVAIPFGVIDKHDSRRIDSVREKPTIELEICAGINVIGPHAKSLIPASVPHDMPELLSSAVRQGLLLEAYLLNGDCLEIGTVKNFHELMETQEASSFDSINAAT